MTNLETDDDSVNSLLPTDSSYLNNYVLVYWKSAVHGKTPRAHEQIQEYFKANLAIPIFLHVDQDERELSTCIDYKLALYIKTFRFTSIFLYDDESYSPTQIPAKRTYLRSGKHNQIYGYTKARATETPTQADQVVNSMLTSFFGPGVCGISLFMKYASNVTLYVLASIFMPAGMYDEISTVSAICANQNAFAQYIHSINPSGAVPETLETDKLVRSKPKYPETLDTIRVILYPSESHKPEALYTKYRYDIIKIAEQEPFDRKTLRSFSFEERSSDSEWYLKSHKKLIFPHPYYLDRKNHNKSVIYSFPLVRTPGVSRAAVKDDHITSDIKAEILKLGIPIPITHRQHVFRRLAGFFLGPNTDGLAISKKTTNILQGLANADAQVLRTKILDFLTSGDTPYTLDLYYAHTVRQQTTDIIYDDIAKARPITGDLLIDRLNAISYYISPRAVQLVESALRYYGHLNLSYLNKHPQFHKAIKVLRNDALNKFILRANRDLYTVLGELAHGVVIDPFVVRKISVEDFDGIFPILSVNKDKHKLIRFLEEYWDVCKDLLTDGIDMAFFGTYYMQCYSSANLDAGTDDMYKREIPKEITKDIVYDACIELMELLAHIQINNKKCSTFQQRESVVLATKGMLNVVQRMRYMHNKLASVVESSNRQEYVQVDDAEIMNS
jgi:hypothetical protein